MNKAHFTDESGVERLAGELELEDQLEAPGGIAGPQFAPGGPRPIVQFQVGTALAGGDSSIAGGNDPVSHDPGAQINAGGGTNGAPGRATVYTDATTGAAGQTLCVATDVVGTLVFGGVRIGAGVPAGAPDGELGIAVDTTAVTGGIYVWDGAAWVKAATI